MADAPETFRPFLGVPPEAVYAVGKAALAAARLESLLRGMVVGFMEYEAGQQLLAEGYVGPSATRVARCLKERDTPAEGDCTSGWRRSWTSAGS